LKKSRDKNIAFVRSGTWPAERFELQVEGGLWLPKIQERIAGEIARLSGQLTKARTGAVARRPIGVKNDLAEAVLDFEFSALVQQLIELNGLVDPTTSRDHLDVFEPLS
jgi:hypothetical protein